MNADFWGLLTKLNAMTTDKKVLQELLWPYAPYIHGNLFLE